MGNQDRKQKFKSHGFAEGSSIMNEIFKLKKSEKGKGFQCVF